MSAYTGNFLLIYNKKRKQAEIVEYRSLLHAYFSCKYSGYFIKSHMFAILLLLRSKHSTQIINHGEF